MLIGSKHFITVCLNAAFYNHSSSSYCWNKYNPASLKFYTNNRLATVLLFQSINKIYQACWEPMARRILKRSFIGYLFLLWNSSMPFCCLPNDQLNRVSWECLSQNQLEKCWRNILSYWKWFPTNCLLPCLD